jgi:hypothetical protein
MCAGIALTESEVPVEWFAQLNADGRVFDRGGEREVRFMYRHPLRFLPVLVEGQLRLIRWGPTKRGRLPMTGWTWLESVETGRWNEVEPKRVVIPANLGFDKGVWFRIREGIHGLLVHDDDSSPIVYMICEPSTRYYQVMTRSDRMPHLVEEVI